MLTRAAGRVPGDARGDAWRRRTPRVARPMLYRGSGVRIMKLYYSPGRSSLAPHIVLRELDRSFDLVRVDLETGRTASGADFFAINPKGMVPVLQLDGMGSAILTEVSAILLYLADLVPD